MSNDCWTSKSKAYCPPYATVTSSVMNTYCTQWLMSSLKLFRSGGLKTKWHHMWATKQEALNLPLKEANGIKGTPSETRCDNTMALHSDITKEILRKWKLLSSPSQHMSIPHKWWMGDDSGDVLYSLRKSTQKDQQSLWKCRQAGPQLSVYLPLQPGTWDYKGEQVHNGPHRKAVLGWVDTVEKLFNVSRNNMFA